MAFKPAGASMVRKQNPRGKKKQVHRCSRCGAVGHRKDGNCPQASHFAQLKKKAIPSWAPPYELHEKKESPRLRDLQQISYPEVCNLSSKQSFKMLKDFGFLPRLRRRKCWKCGEKLRVTSKVLRCSKRDWHFHQEPSDIMFAPVLRPWQGAI